MVGVGAREECGALGCWRWNSSTAAGAWTSAWGSHMLSKCGHLTNLTRYYNLPHLNLESRISLTSYSSWSSTMMGPGCRGCRHSTISSGMWGWTMETDMMGWMFFSHAERWSLIAAGEM